MIPREHLPLTLVTFALVGLLFLMYRELSAVKTAVAQLSVPPPAIHAGGEGDSDDDENDDDADDENADDEMTDAIKMAARAPVANAAGRAGRAGRAGGAGAAVHAENREKSTDAPETALPRVSKPSANSSSKDSALKLRK